jgi:hypothetical protein
MNNGRKTAKKDECRFYVGIDYGTSTSKRPGSGKNIPP